MPGFVIKLSDVARCPKGSWSAQHYYPNGTCKCNELPAKKERLAQLETERRETVKRLDEEIRRLRDEIKS